ncbi:hypothetical protein ACSVH2_06365 [Flavobacterium sp. RSB2_4_14]|uniref:hypothetical protein n=1 Tax=Flavobacterium sp. RSB2_4_14 TaxID=3447665 RepID=UPI003F3B66C0
MKTKLNLVLVAFIIAIGNGFSQEKKPFILKQNDNKGDIVMTWNSTTPEQEMKDDIKALADHGVTITYDNVRRNSKGEITAIKVTYADRKGNKGTMEMDNQKPINTIKFFKQGEDVGFGEPKNNDFFASANGFGGFPNGQNPMQFFNFGQGRDDENSKSYSFNFSDDNAAAKSRMFIQKDGKNPLIIEDGEVIQGGDDYTKEEIEELKKNNKIERTTDDFPNFNFNNQGNLAEKMKKMQEQLNQLMQKQQGNNQPEESDKSLQESKEELEKAKEELKKAKQELEKTKSTFKTQKA